MSETKRDQVVDLERAEAQWNDDPDQRQPYPHEDLLRELRETVDSGLGDDPPVRLAELAALKRRVDSGEGQQSPYREV